MQAFYRRLSISSLVLALAGPVMFALYVEARGQGPGPGVIHVGDVIEIDQIGGTEFDWRGVVLADGRLDGFETYGDPLIARCKTESELEREVEASFSKILREPKFKVMILDRSGRPFATIDGAVRSPSRLSIRRDVRIREVIALAGGLLDTVAGDIVIGRQSSLSCSADESGTGFAQVRVRLADLINGDEKANLIILPGDAVLVTKASVIYVIGGVRDPGPVYVRDSENVNSVIEKAGGFAKDAKRGEITLIRRSGNTSRVFQCGTGEVPECDINTTALQAFDIIDVAVKGDGGRRSQTAVIGVEETSERSPDRFPLRIID